jgi:NADPH:quinone reductase-like Zn-dependent oxidoreductase
MAGKDAIGGTILFMRTIFKPADKTQRLRALGADDVINYRLNHEWYKEVLALTEDRGADLVLETGGTDTLEQSVLAIS